MIEIYLPINWVIGVCVSILLIMLPMLKSNWFENFKKESLGLIIFLFTPFAFFGLLLFYIVIRTLIF